jgi:hypothetical protein
MCQVPAGKPLCVEWPRRFSVENARCRKVGSADDTRQEPAGARRHRRGAIAAPTRRQAASFGSADAQLQN